MKKSEFKSRAANALTDRWINAVIEKFDLNYQKIDAVTSFGTTRVLAVNHSTQHLKPLVYVPDARTGGAFLDLSNTLRILSDRYRIYLLDLVGQIRMSDGNCSNLNDESYVVWLDEMCRHLPLAVLCRFLGLLLAVPIVAVVFVLVKMLYVEDILGRRVEVKGERKACAET